MNGVMNNSNLQDAQLRLQGFQNFVNDRAVADGTDVRLGDGDAGGITREQSASWHDRTWHSGRAEVRRSIDRNNAVRQNFLDALIDVYGEGNKSRGFWCLPEYIRKALKGRWACGQAGDFKLVADDSAAHGFRVTSGRPLSVRRIRAVFRAIAREEIRKGQTNSVAGVNNVGGKKESEKFKTTFTGFFEGYNFGTPLVGHKGSGKTANPLLSYDEGTIFKILIPNILTRRMMEKMNEEKIDMTDSSRTSGELYSKLKQVFDYSITAVGVLQMDKDSNQYENAIDGVFKNFIVAFNKENHGFAITIPQEEIEAQSQQQDEQPQQV